MDLTHAVERVEAIRRKFGVESIAPQLAACREMLTGGGVVDVAVLGQFKAGKSSFLNGLIGGAVVPVDVLPVDVLPSTAVVTRIGYGQRERVTVHRLSGEALEIPLSRLAEFVTERGNPANEKRVAVVDVELPSLASYEGVRFVDTPGLGSVFAHNTRVSKEWTILPVSNRPGFEGMRNDVAEYLRDRIAGRREEAFGEIARHKVHALVAGCREYLNLAERAAGAADAARSDLVAALARERRGFGSVTGEIWLLCNHLKAEVRTAANERFHACHGEVTGRVTATLRDAAAFLEREIETIAGLVGEADAGNRGEEVRAALAELDDLESGVC